MNTHVIIHYNAPCGCKWLDRVYCAAHKAQLDEQDRKIAGVQRILADLERMCVIYQARRKQIIDTIGYDAQYEESYVNVTPLTEINKS